MGKITVFANAKVNLSLDILGKLPSGYHSLEMVMQSVPLRDTLEIETKAGDGIEILCEDTAVPKDSRNLAYKAAQLFLDKTGIKSKVIISLDKKIPAAAGMAGGSSDAAAVFRGLNKIFQNPLTKNEILSLCLKVGADVPFCLEGGCAICRGIGEELMPIKPLRNAVLLISKPDFSVSTKWVYENFKMEQVEKRPYTNAVVSAIEIGDLKALAENTANVLESVTEREYAEISQYKRLMKDRGAILSMMSGSGPTVFGIFDDENKAKVAYDELKTKNDNTFILKI